MRVPNVIDTVTSHLFGFGRAVRMALTTDESEKERAPLAMAGRPVCLWARDRASVRWRSARAMRARGRATVAGGGRGSPPSSGAPVARRTTTSANVTHIASPTPSAPQAAQRRRRALSSPARVVA